MDDESAEDREWRLENEAANAIRDFTPVQAANRLHQLQSSAHLSDRQRAEKAKLEGWVRTSAAVLADGGFFDSRRMEGVGHPSSTAAPNRRPGQTIQRAPVGRFANQAHRVLDALHGRGLPDHAATVADGLIRHPAGAGDQVDAARDLAARWLSVCGSPAYESAFARILADPRRVARPWTKPSGSLAGRQADPDPHWAKAAPAPIMVPTILDPAILLSNAGSNNPLRQVARVETITTDRWHGVTSAGGQREWSARPPRPPTRARYWNSQACRYTKWIASRHSALRWRAMSPA